MKIRGYYIRWWWLGGYLTKKFYDTQHLLYNPAFRITMLVSVHNNFRNVSLPTTLWMPCVPDQSSDWVIELHVRTVDKLRLIGSGEMQLGQGTILRPLYMRKLEKLAEGCTYLRESRTNHNHSWSSQPKSCSDLVP
jgi:hypothetical protein